MFLINPQMNVLIPYAIVSLILIGVCYSENDGANPLEMHHDGNSTSATLNTEEGPVSDKKKLMHWCNDQHEDFVYFIPGYIPMAPPSCWYSGYVSYELAGTLIHTHYTLQTAELLTKDNKSSNGDINSPFSKPLIYWSSYVCFDLLLFSNALDVSSANLSSLSAFVTL
jgi:hypothetical protein